MKYLCLNFEGTVSLFKGTNVCQFLSLNRLGVCLTLKCIEALTMYLKLQTSISLKVSVHVLALRTV